MSAWISTLRSRTVFDFQVHGSPISLEYSWFIERGTEFAHNCSPFSCLLALIFVCFDVACSKEPLVAMPAPLPPDDSVAWKVWLGSVVSVALATIAVAARLLARRLSAAPYWWDDWTIIASLVRLALIWKSPGSIGLVKEKHLTAFLGSAMGYGHFSMDHSCSLLLRSSCCICRSP